MTYPADAFGGGVQGAWYDAQTIGDFNRDGGAAFSDYGTEPNGRFFDLWQDKSPNNNDLASAQTEWDPVVHDVGGGSSGKYVWSWHAQQGNTAGGSTTGFYMAIAHQADDIGQYYSELWSDVNTTNTGFRLEYTGDGDQHGLSNSGYIFSAGTGASRTKAAISSGDPLYSFENGKKLIECWWTAAAGLNIRINKGTPVTVACGSVSAGTTTFRVMGGNANNWLGRMWAYMHTKNSALDSTGRDACAVALAAVAGITLPSSGPPPITGDMHAREAQIDDDFTAVAPAGNQRIGAAIISESAVSDTFLALQPQFQGARSGSAAISESASSDIFSAVRQTVDTIDANFLAWLQSEDRLSTILVEADDVVFSPGPSVAIPMGMFDETALRGGWLDRGEDFRGVFDVAYLSVDTAGQTITTRYMSNNGYTTGSGDTPASTHYEAVVTGGGQISEVLPIDGTAAMAFGDVEISNADGALDTWLDDVWVGRACRIYIGDQRWARNQFKLIFNGIIDNLASRSRNVLNLMVRDKLQKLNTSVTETKLGGTSANADRVLPLTFGEVHNVTPLLIDKSTLKYQFHHSTGAWNPAERVIEVRDNGVPVAFTANLPVGEFTLTNMPFGTVTASVQGDTAPYFTTVGRLIQLIVKNGGNTPLTDSDIDAPSILTFDAQNPQPIGLYLGDTANVLEVCQRLAASVGAQVIMTATGLLRLVKIALPATVTPTAVGLTQIIEGSLEIADRPPVVAAVKIGYCRNWTPQPSLQTAIPAEHKDLFAQEWLTSTAKDAAVATSYRLTQEPEQQDTLLLTKVDADAEALRRLNLWKVQRTVFRYQGTAELLVEQLGGYQTITNRRFGLALGKTGQILGIQRDWMMGRVTIDLLV